MKNRTAIARTGTFRDSEGRKRTFTKEDLDKIAYNYSVSETDAPLVIGHIKTDSAPAYGWVDSLFVEDEKLWATFSCVSEEVKNLVYKGAYRNTSMSVDMENHRLLHVALLGAAAPAIDGLGAVNLSSDKGISVFSVENLQQKENSMNEAELKKKIEELEKELLELKASLSQANTEKAEAEQKAEQVQAEFSAYKAKQKDDERLKRVEKLIADGKLVPAKKDEVYAFASQLAKSSADFSFGTEKLSMEEKYFKDLEAQPKLDIFANFSNKPAHSQENQETWVSPAAITAKL